MSEVALAPPKGLKPDSAGKLRRLRLFPGFTLTTKSGLARRLHARRTEKAAQRLRQSSLAPLLNGQDPLALPQDAADLLYLYDTVSSRKVERAIEFGSGQSTLFISQALHDQGHGHLWSLDANNLWLEHTKAMLPEHLRPFVTFVHSPVRIVQDYGVPAWRYTVVPDGKWDFVLMDGPEGTGQEPGGSDMTTNLIEMADSLNPGATGFIDHRWMTAVLTKENASDRLRLRFIPSLESWEFQPR